MDTSLISALAVAALSVVCWPSARWQRLLLGGLAALARVGVLGMLAGLGVQAISPGSVPGSLPALVEAAADRNHLDPATACLLLAVMVACAAVPLLAGLDFARSLADNRAVSRALRTALQVLQQYDPTLDPGAIPPVFPAAAYRAPVKPEPDKHRRVGDLING